MSKQLNSEIEVSLQGERVILRGDGTLFLPHHEALLIADLHLGKDASFRAAGISVPEGINLRTLELFKLAIDETNTSKAMILGDLIHDRNSFGGKIIEQFENWRQTVSQVEFTLVRGNHDRHVRTFPSSWNLLEVHLATLGSIELRHEINDSTLRENRMLQIGGHWHPVVMVGQGADRMRLPCFVVGNRHITLPAFGPFKGGMTQKRLSNHDYFVTCERKIWKS